MKKIISLLTLLLFAVNFTFLAFSASAEEAKPSKEMLRQQSALSAYYDLCEMFKLNGTPSNYAGEYIDGSDLVILISDDDRSPYRILSEKHSCIKFKTTKYSYNELNSLLDEAVDLLMSSEKGKKLCVSSYINVMNNSADIEINAMEYIRLTESEREKLLIDGVNYKFVNFSSYGLDSVIAAEKDGARGWSEINGERFYIKSDGAFATKSTTIDGVRYTFDKFGVCTGRYTGWTKSDKGRKYWRNGILVKNRAFKVKGISYYADENGIASPAMVITVACPDGAEYVSYNGGETWCVDGKETDAPAVFVKNSGGYPVKLSQGLSIDICNTSGSWMSLLSRESLSIWKNNEWAASPFRDGIADLDSDLDGLITDAKKYPVTISFDKYEHENGRYRYKADVRISVYDARKDDIYTFTIEFYAIADNAD